MIHTITITITITKIGPYTLLKETYYNSAFAIGMKSNPGLDNYFCRISSNQSSPHILKIYIASTFEQPC